MKKYIKHQLQNDPWLTQFPAEAQAEMISASLFKQFHRGSVIHRKGDAPAGLIRVLKGRVRAGATTTTGAEFLLTTVVEGEWFGEISILDGKPRTHDAFAHDDCEIALFPVAALMGLCEKYPQVQNGLVMLLCGHCREAFKALDDFLLLSPEQRLAKRLLEIDERQGGSNQITMSQQDLSDLLGVSRQSINKILKSWERAGIVARKYRGLCLTSPSRLEQIGNRGEASAYLN